MVVVARLAVSSLKSDPKYNDRLFVDTESKRSLYLGTEWYHFFEKMVGTHCVRD